MSKKKYYKLPGVKGKVRPVDGEDLPKPQPGLSHGFQHYVDKNGNLMGFCGVSFWAHNAKEINK